MTLSGLGGGVLVGLGSGVAIALAALLGVWWERKVAGRIQLRYGPQTTGPAGLLQTLADTLKLVLKEDVTPRLAEPAVFRAAPLVVFAPVATALAVVPLAAGWAPFDSTVGMLLFVAVPSVSAVGVLLGAWASRNTFATLGGVRAAAQMVSYEVPRTLSVLSVVVLAGSLRPVAVLDAWRWWWVPLLGLGFVIYFIASIAEVNRGPFDIPEAESELVAGYFADYTGIRWAVFMMAEYGGMLAAALFGAAAFLGGPRALPGPFGGIVFAAEAVAIVTAMVWIKWSFPRLRQDQLMSFAWKVLTPAALVQLALVGVVVPWL